MLEEQPKTTNHLLPQANETMASDQHIPLSMQEEIANGITHGAAALAGIIGAVWMIRQASEQPVLTALSCLVYVLSATAVFTASALSHFWFDRSVWLTRLRAWDQGLIYVMIAGTYTPLIWQYADSLICWPLMGLVWLGALAGFYSKVMIEHRVNSIGVKSYLMLAILPAVGLIGRVPAGLLYWMVLGALAYLVGIVFLLNDRKFKYLHVLWHLCVIFAAVSHYFAFYNYIATSGI